MEDHYGDHSLEHDPETEQHMSLLVLRQKTVEEQLDQQKVSPHHQGARFFVTFTVSVYYFFYFLLFFWLLLSLQKQLEEMSERLALLQEKFESEKDRAEVSSTSCLDKGEGGPRGRATSDCIHPPFLKGGATLCVHVIVQGLYTPTPL